MGKKNLNRITFLQLQRLCGRRAKRQQQDMQLIDVSGATIMPDPKEWLTKQMTQEQNTKIHSHSHRKNDGPTTQQRRKHQITYLAFQVWMDNDKVYCLYMVQSWCI
jgi:proline-rich protein PRCC